jgi:energy-converting hydrogenase B subunit Q
MADPLALLVSAPDRPGVLYQVAEAIYRHGGNVTYVSTVRSSEPGRAEIQIEIGDAPDPAALLDDLRGLEAVDTVAEVPPFQAVFGKRVIVIGGGAQVGMVAQGAVAEADRHNIRGERISVDTIPLVGEDRLAEAVRATARLHRAQVLVLAGALMGGDITEAVREIQRAGIIVVSLSMAGSVADAVDLVVTDPLEAGVMAVMLIADTARFSIDKVRGRRF